MTTWADLAQSVLDAMDASGVDVTRRVIAPGPPGARCRQFSVYPTSIGVAPAAFSTLPAPLCSIVQIPAMAARFTADCCPMPGNDGTQPDPAAQTAWTKTFLDDCRLVWAAVVDAFQGDCVGVTIGAATFFGPSGGVASMTIPIAMSDDGVT